MRDIGDILKLDAIPEAKLVLLAARYLNKVSPTAPEVAAVLNEHQSVAVDGFCSLRTLGINKNKIIEQMTIDDEWLEPKDTRIRSKK